jgi:hypothetical protein
MQIITRNELRQVLLDWQAGNLQSSDLHDWATDRHAVSTCEPEDDIVNEILGEIDMLDMNLTTTEDATVLLQMLELPAERIDEAIGLWEGYRKTIDYETRKRQCKTDPLYSPYCNGI